MRRKVSLTQFVLLFALAVAPLDAGTEFILTTEAGTQLTGGTVCFYRITGDAQHVAPREHWFTGREVRCLPAGTLLDIPIGAFHFFATHHDGFVTSMRHTMESTELAPVDSYKKVTLILSRAGVLDFSRVKPLLRKDEYFGAWVVDSDQYPGTLIPAVGDGTEIMVPADRAALPLLISGGEPRLIGEMTRVDANRSTLVQLRLPAPGTGDVLAWMEIEPGYIENNVRRRSDLRSISVVARGEDGRRFASVLPLLHPSNLLGSLQVFKGVPAQRLTVQIEGKTWEQDEITVPVVPQAVTVTSRGLRTVPAANLSVLYTVPPTSVSVETAARPGGCEHGTTAENAAVAFTLFRCQQNHPLTAPIDVTECAILRRRNVPLTQSIAFDDSGLSPGTYVVEASHAALGRQRAQRTIAFGDDLAVDLLAAGAPVFGRVTRSGRPAANTKVIFHEDTPKLGLAVTNSEGEFATYVPADPGTTPTRVEACDGSFHYLYAANTRQDGAPYDIDIPSNRLIVHVYDATTGTPIRDARVRYVVTDDENEKGAFIAEDATVDGNGQAQFESILPEKSIHVCGRRQGYQRTCAPLLALREDEQRSIDLRLPKTGVKKGRVRGIPIEFARVFFVQEVTGVITEISNVIADGTFEVKRDHAVNEYAVLVSTNQPLLVFPPNAIHRGEELQLSVNTFPRVLVFTIALNKNDVVDSRIVTISIGGRIVPADAFAFHMHNRHSYHLPTKRSPITVRDIAETGPVVVHLAMSPDDLRPGTLFNDIFARPEYASLIHHRSVTSTTTLIAFP